MSKSVGFEKPLVKSTSIRVKPMQRSTILFLSAIKSKVTKKLYTNELEKFRKYYLIKNNDSLISIDSKKTQEMIEDYIFFLKNRNLSYASIHNSTCSLKLFYSMNDIMCNWTKLNKMLPEKVKARGEKPYTTDQLRVILKQVSNSPLWTALVHFISASGAREGFSEELRIKDIENFKDGCKSVKVYADSKDEYYCFIHQEAVKALEEYFEYRTKKGEKLTPDSWVFTTALTPTKPMTTNLISSWFTRIVSRTNVYRGELINSRYDIQIVYGMRKRFNTILKSNSDVNSNIAEKLIGHSTSIPLDNHYFKPTLEVIFEEYQKSIPDLIIDENMKLKLELEQKNEELSSIAVKDRTIEKMQDTISMLKLNLELINEKLS